VKVQGLRRGSSPRHSTTNVARSAASSPSQQLGKKEIMILTNAELKALREKVEQALDADKPVTADWAATVAAVESGDANARS
jgi:hypothetical protein